MDTVSISKNIGLHSTEASLDRDISKYKSYAERSVIFEPGHGRHNVLYVKSGWAMTYKILPSGTRIVTDFLLQGDIISTAAADLAQETVATVTDVVIAEFPDLFAETGPMNSSRHMRIVVMEMLRRQARMSERLANIGGRDGLERMAHLLLELAFRAHQSKKAPLNGLLCPLRQADLGDAVGLSTVHTNRVLKEMRTHDLAYFRHGIVEFPDRRRLMDAVNFNPDYLSLELFD